MTAVAIERIGWRADRTATGDPREPATPALVWVDCPACGAQRRLWAEGAWRACGSCLGIGQVPR